ncbi:transaldolase [bacterium]|nr:transaldolase [candidate division CSSED10-310 bacterium]
MSIYLDSANYDEAIEAARLGWVAGVTTNPLLLAGEAHASEERGSPRTIQIILERLSQLDFGQVFYQMTGTKMNALRAELNRIRTILGDHLVVKIPPTELGFSFMREISAKVPCCATALFSVAQAIAAMETGASYVAVYLERAERAGVEGMALLSTMARCLDGSGTSVIAASIKSRETMEMALAAGARHVTLPWRVMQRIIHHPLSDEAVRHFTEQGMGL